MIVLANINHVDGGTSKPQVSVEQIYRRLLTKSYAEEASMLNRAERKYAVKINLFVCGLLDCGFHASILLLRSALGNLSSLSTCT